MCNGKTNTEYVRRRHILIVQFLLRLTAYEIHIPGLRRVRNIPADCGELHHLSRDWVAPQAASAGPAIAAYVGMCIIGDIGRGVQLPHVGIQGQILAGDVFGDGMDVHVLPARSSRGAPDGRGGTASCGGGCVHRRCVSSRVHYIIAPFPSFDRFFAFTRPPGSRFVFPLALHFFLSVIRGAVRSSSGTPTLIIQFGMCSSWQVSLFIGI